MENMFLTLDERIDQVAKLTYSDLYQGIDQLIEEYPEEEVYPKMVARLDSFSTKLRRAAIYGIAKMNKEDTPTHLMLQLRSSKRGIRQETRKALNEIGGERVVQVLSQGLGCKDWFARETAGKALAELGTPEALPTLINVVFNDRSDKVRKASAIAIQKILERSGGNSLEKLEEFLEPYRNMPGYRGIKFLESKLVLETCESVIKNVS
ncbi:MAG: HEAT repeat domain-containing protein [Halanaerobiales bacterium]|nr:HEAT repeat domain-containing protein [Halanaerobiales bacterium]